MNFIPYGRQEVTSEDIEAVIQVLRSDWLTQGPTVERFETAIRNFCGAPYAIAVNSGTSALHLACRILGLKEGDWLWTSPITFVASANCGLYCGAKIDFVDIDPNTLNMSITALENKLIQAKKEGRLPKIIIPVHFGGQPCDMDAINRLKKKYGFSIIEDACHALGASWQNHHIGCGKTADATVFSFHPVKLVTTGEGGILTVNSEKHQTHALELRSHGITRDTQRMEEGSDALWYYQQVDLGYNYRITDIQAALGVTQMQRLSRYVKRRNTLADRYQKHLQNLPLVLPTVDPKAYSAWHLYPIRFRDQDKPERRRLFEALRVRGIGVNVHYIPVHLQPYYRKMGFKEGDFPEAERYYRQAVTLPLFHSMSNAMQDQVIAAIKEILS
ncbi:UDP-4-amino-4,6-dideoxy-N-acetyl-beta-L-altrosamine transaminase [Magnetococcales bacterium HHB-1]